MSDPLPYPASAPRAGRERHAAALAILIAISALTLSVAVAATAVSFELVRPAAPERLIPAAAPAPAHHDPWKFRKAPAAIAKPLV